MPDAHDLNGANFEKVNLTLNEGLKSCRAIVSGYRALIAGSSDNDNLDAENSAAPIEISDALGTQSQQNSNTS
ncbi:hypothetical protein [Sphingomonas sp.]|uniref:hypothetical protein n=1 Tax=Sphingomonas sp. TaxID=28214 RepID=UPI0038AF12BA